MRAFAGMPVLELPSTASPERLLELRIYESNNEQKARLKVEMFNEGEIDIMRDVKLAPVFFGETLISDDLPNLTYILSADNAEIHRQHFQDFLKHPDWDRMKRLEKYKGTVSKIISITLSPATCSQI
ncbi:MAG: NIPSNAP family protein [Fuerstiella sp.]